MSMNVESWLHVRSELGFFLKVIEMSHIEIYSEVLWLKNHNLKGF